MDTKAQFNGPDQQLYKDTAVGAKNDLRNFLSQQPADRENSAETDWCQY